MFVEASNLFSYRCSCFMSTELDVLAIGNFAIKTEQDKTYKKAKFKNEIAKNLFHCLL